MDDNLSILVGFLAGLLYALSQAAESALHNYSHTKLEKMLPNQERLDQVNGQLKDFDRHLFSLWLSSACFATLFAILSYRGLVSYVDGAALPIVLGIAVILFTGIVREVVYRNPENLILRLLPVVGITTKIWSPITVPFMAVGSLVESSMSGSEESSDEDDAVEDILDAVSEGEAGGVLQGAAADYIENIMDARDRVVREIMTPRTSVISARNDLSLDAALEILSAHGHSRVPIFEESRDNIVGLLYFKDVLRHIGELQAGEKQLVEILRPPLFVPESKKINDLLSEFQTQKIHIAIVLDEFGSTSGVVTMEDILEEIVGEVHDEFDDDQEAFEFDVMEGGRVEIDATMSIDFLNERLDLSLPEDGDFDTIGGLIAAQMGKVPASGEILSVAGVEIEVAEADERRVKRVRIKTLVAPESD